jgi:SAM-dependent methyltransferase
MMATAARGATIDPGEASQVGGRTLEVFAETPRLNDWLFSKLAGAVRGEVLEIGSGIGNLSRLIAARADRLVATDMEPHYLRALRELFAGDARVDVLAYDLDGPAPPAIAARRFDAIMAVNVIEHIRDDQALVRTLAGLLRPGGSLLVYVPACPLAYGHLDRALGHHRRYTPATLTALLGGAGLSVEPPRYMNLLGLIGWITNGRLFRRKLISPSQLALFERLVPILRLEDQVRLPVGLGLHVRATKP